MSDCKFVIKGEAPESDEESKESVKSSSPMQAGLKSGYGVAVNGEAPESDEELVSYSKQASVLADSPQIKKTTAQKKFIKDSILQKRLCENNASLWKNLNDLQQSTILSASKQLLNADQQLMKSQVTLQSISYNFKATNTATKQILARTKDIVTENFIPSIRI